MKVSSCITVIFHREPFLQILLLGRVFLNTFIPLLLSLFASLILKHSFSPLLVKLFSLSNYPLVSFVKYIYIISHRMVRRMPGDHLVQYPCPKQCQLCQQVAQGPVQSDRDFLIPLPLFLEQTYCLVNSKELKHQVSCTCT